MHNAQCTIKVSACADMPHDLSDHAIPALIGAKSKMFHVEHLYYKLPL